MRVCVGAYVCEPRPCVFETWGLYWRLVSADERGTYWGVMSRRRRVGSLRHRGSTIA